LVEVFMKFKDEPCYLLLAFELEAEAMARAPEVATAERLRQAGVSADVVAANYVLAHPDIRDFAAVSS
jgi:hypothetical protein